MPFIIPFIPLLAAGIGAGTSIGLDLSNQPSTPKPTVATPTPASTTPSATQAADARLVASNTQAAAPGVSSGYLGQNISSNLGLSPDSPIVQQIINQLGIGNGPPTSGVGGGTSLTTTSQGNAVGGTNPLTDFLASQGGQTGGLVNNAIQQDFKGFSG